MVVTSSGLADKLSPRLREILQAHEKEIVGRAGNVLARSALSLAWPHILDEIPFVMRAAIDLIKVEFGQMNVTDLLTFLENHVHATQEGQQ